MFRIPQQVDVQQQHDFFATRYDATNSAAQQEEYVSVETYLSITTTSNCLKGGNTTNKACVCIGPMYLVITFNILHKPGMVELIILLVLYREN